MSLSCRVMQGLTNVTLILIKSPSNTTICGPTKDVAGFFPGKGASHTSDADFCSQVASNCNIFYTVDKCQVYALQRQTLCRLKFFLFSFCFVIIVLVVFLQHLCICNCDLYMWATGVQRTSLTQSHASSFYLFTFILLFHILLSFAASSNLTAAKSTTTVPLSEKRSTPGSMKHVGGSV